MGSCDGAEICEQVGTFLLSQLLKYDKRNIGLHRDAGLAIFKNTTSDPQNERIKQDLIRIFKKHGLKLEITCNLKQTDYLDVTLPLINHSASQITHQDTPIVDQITHQVSSNNYLNPYLPESQTTQATRPYLKTVHRITKTS